MSRLSLTRRKNPFDKLPDEVLLDIFTLLVRPVDVDSTHRHDQDVATAMHVCQRWRGIVLSTPTFWTDISLGTRTAMRVGDAVELSRPLPLTVVFNTIAYDGDEAIPAWDRQWSALVGARQQPGERIRNLVVRSSDVRDSQISREDVLSLPLLVAATLPVLECLTIVAPASVFGVVVNFEFSPIYRITDAFKSLHTLRLRYAKVSTDASFYRQLSHLSIHCSFCDRHGYSHSLLLILRNTPNLETLEFAGHPFCPDERQEHCWVPPSSPVDLPRMRYVSLEARPSIMDRIVPYLAIPPATRFRLTYVDTWGSAFPLEPTRLPPAVGSLRSAALAIEHSTLSNGTPFRTVAVRAYVDPDGAHSARGPPDAVLRVPNGSPRECLLHLGRALGALEEVVVERFTEQVEKDTARAVLESLTHCTTIRLVRCAPHVAVALFDALQPPPTTPVCAALRAFEMHELENTDGLWRFWPALREMAEARREMGVPLARVVLSRGPWRAESLGAQRMKELVDEFVVR